MVGQEHVVRALTTALESERLHHAYLFTGTRGVGKTTVARLIAKSLNCEEGVTATPCGVCASCVEIAEGRSVDVLEVDAASRTKVEDTRELLDNVQYAPTRSRFKIYLIDEVHMLSNHSFNALLKTLEEPPSHVKFLLATTDPQKLPATVLSRCLQFNLKNMVPAQIIEHLKHVLSEESVSCDDESLALLARGAEGSMRDALSLTDQAIAHGSGKLVGGDVRAMLGTVSRTKVLDLLQAISASDVQQALAMVDDLATHSPDYSGALDELSGILHQIAIEQAVPGSLDEASPEFSRLQDLAKHLTTDDTQLLWQMAVASKRDLVLASDPRSGLDMAVLRMIAFRPAVIISDAHEAPPAKKPEPPVMPVETPVPSTQVAPTATHHSDLSGDATASDSSVVPSSRASKPDSASDGNEVSCDNTAVDDAHASNQRHHSRPSGISEESHAKSASLTGETSAVAVKDNADSDRCVEKQVSPIPEGAKTPDDDLPTPGSWPDFFESLDLKGVIHNVASHFELIQAYDRTLCFAIAQDNATLYNERHQRGLASAMEGMLGEAVEVQVSFAATSENTPARHREILEQQRLQAAQTALDEDDCLSALLVDFDAVVIPNSVKPPLTEL
jgi:DNA polymerase-3 subunit gamma/tau